MLQIFYKKLFNNQLKITGLAHSKNQTKKQYFVIKGTIYNFIAKNIPYSAAESNDIIMLYRNSVPKGINSSGKS